MHVRSFLSQFRSFCYFGSSASLNYACVRHVENGNSRYSRDLSEYIKRKFLMVFFQDLDKIQVEYQMIKIRFIDVSVKPI